MKEFVCSCPVTKCPHHPSNHEEGCDSCIQKNVRKKEVPTCLFKAVHEDVSDVKDYSIKGFVEFYLAHQDENSEN